MAVGGRYISDVGSGEPPLTLPTERERERFDQSAICIRRHRFSGTAQKRITERASVSVPSVDTQSACACTRGAMHPTDARQALEVFNLAMAGRTPRARVISAKRGCRANDSAPRLRFRIRAFNSIHTRQVRDLTTGPVLLTTLPA